MKINNKKCMCLGSYYIFAEKLLSTCETRNLYAYFS